MPGRVLQSENLEFDPWALYLGGSDHLVNRRAETTIDPIFAGRMAVNGRVG